MAAIIKAIASYLPDKQLTNADLKKRHPDWPMEKIAQKTGISSRSISSEMEFSTDLGIKAAEKLLREHEVSRQEIDFILFCTQTPKYIIPTNACLIQQALGLGTSVGALDINQGCSGYVYSLMLASGLVNQGIAKNVLLITADTYTKLVAQDNRALIPIFGDGASATLISYDNSHSGLAHFDFGTDGRGAEKLISKSFGMQGLVAKEKKCGPDLYMDGPAIFNFTLEAVPALVSNLLDKANLKLNDIDQFIFHQANAYMLENLREKIKIPKSKFLIDVEHTGNLVSSSIPVVLSRALSNKTIQSGNKLMLVGFGVGLSWAASVLEI